MQLLRASVDLDLPEPRLQTDLPSDQEFHAGEVPEWVPDGETENSQPSSRDGLKSRDDCRYECSCQSRDASCQSMRGRASGKDPLKSSALDI